MRSPDRDTIFAVATGAGRAAVAIIRLSGPQAKAALAELAGRMPPARKASLRRLRNAEGEVLDHALVIWFPGPASYTGEDVAELHLHAGNAVIDGVADALVHSGLRPAEPGEFTRRAFLNGRMDLTEAEAIGDLVAAETAAQRRQALRQMAGELGALYQGWAGRLRLLLAQQEALIDFPDEDLPPEVETATLVELDVLIAELGVHLDDDRRGERIRHGLVIAVSGPPNVGKSSLVNALAGRDVAIVSPAPGTTRDAIEVRLEMGGVPATLVDTAGLRETQDPVEAEGVSRAQARAAEADIVLAVCETGQEVEAPPRQGGLLVANKVDLGGAIPEGALGVSALTGAGIQLLRDRLIGEARALIQATGPPPLTRLRHRTSVRAAADALAAARQAGLPELRAEELRLALRSLGRITGAVGVEDILDTIFSRFCIGK